MELELVGVCVGVLEPVFEPVRVFVKEGDDDELCDINADIEIDAVRLGVVDGVGIDLFGVAVIDAE